MKIKQKVYSAVTVANEILKRAKNEGIEISHLKLQKLVYYAHAWHLVFFDRPLIKEEVQAWKYGPVIPDLFYKCSKWKSSRIDNFLQEGDEEPFFDPKDNTANAVVNKIIETYGQLSPGQLSTLAHSPQSAWGRTRKYHHDGSSRGYILTNDVIGVTEGDVLKEPQKTEIS